MTTLKDTLSASGRDPWIYLILGVLFVLMAATDLLDDYAGNDLDGVTYALGAVSLLSFFGASRFSVPTLKWVGYVAFAGFVGLWAADLFGWIR